MSITSSIAQASPNIAFIKYWGNRDVTLRLPMNGSISMNLDGLITRTAVEFDDSLSCDELALNNAPVSGKPLERVSRFLDIVREMSGITARASVVSANNFPMGAGIASSASAFAALSLAASNAAGMDLSEPELSRLARRGSGSACRSVPGGFVEWYAGDSEENSYAETFAEGNHFGLVDCIAIVEGEHKAVGSTEGHAIAGSSILQDARVANAAHRLAACREAILKRDFDQFAQVVELDSNLMHAVMMTSTPALLYWQPASIQIMKTISAWRHQGIPVCYTLDAGPNVHALCLTDAARAVESGLRDIPGVYQVLSANPGGAAHLV